MDDNMSLAALAGTKPKVVDENASLASLVTARKPSIGGARAAPALVRRPSTGGEQGQVKRTRPESSSSSSDSTSDSSSDSNNDKPIKKKVRVKGAGKAKPKAKAKVKKEDGSDSDADDDHGGKVNKRDRNAKQTAVAELLCRWWYVLPEWPPADPAYYEQTLLEAKLRKVEIPEWEWVPEEKDGLKKCYELSQFKGLYRDSTGELVDLRPKEGCPNFNNFMQWEMPRIYSLLAKAYEAQLEELEKSIYDEEANKTLLRVGLNRARNKLAQASSLSEHGKRN